MNTILGAMDAVLEALGRGETVRLRPSGNSMVPLIRSRQEVTVAPVHAGRLEVGDVVMVRVSGRVFVHKVAAVDPARARVQISNNRGRVNGWAPWGQVYGIVTAVDGAPRPGVAGKVATYSSS